MRNGGRGRCKCEIPQILRLRARAGPKAHPVSCSACTGTAGQKGRVMGILRSLGALARALGPVLAAAGERGLAFLPLFGTRQPGGAEGHRHLLHGLRAPEQFRVKGQRKGRQPQGSRSG